MSGVDAPVSAFKFWALSYEKKIPENGVNTEIVGEYNPNNSGFGEKFKKSLKPIKVGK